MRCKKWRGEYCDATVWWGGPGKAGDGHVYAEIWGRPDGTEVEMYSEPSYMDANGSERVTHQKIPRGKEVLFDGVLHKDAHEPLKDQHGNTIPPVEVPVAAVNP